MGFIGNQPTDVPLTGSQLADSIITSAKILDGTIVNADINASAAIVGSKLTTLAGNVAFPATQVPSADANTLDDYEEGSFTPVLQSPGTATYTTQVGRYTKIGNRVFINLHITINSIGTGGGHLAGLPFTSNTTTPGTNGGIVFYQGSGAIAAGTNITGEIPENNTIIYLYLWDGTSNPTALTGANISDSGTIQFSGFYDV